MLCDSSCGCSIESISKLWDTLRVQILPLAAPGATLRPLFYLNLSNLLLHSKTCHLAPDYYHISLMFSLAITQTLHYTCRNRGTFTQCKTPLFWHKNNRALLFSKWHKHIMLVEKPTKWLRGRQCIRSCVPWEGRGALCEVQTTPHPHTHPNPHVRSDGMKRMVRTPTLPEPCRVLPSVRPGCNPRLHHCKHSILLLGACCFCCQAWDWSEIKLNSLPSEREGEANFELEIGYHAQLLLADVLRTGTHRQSHTHLGVTQQ